MKITSKQVLKRLGMLILLSGCALLLASCGKSDKEKRRETRIDYGILYTYQYDVVRVVVEKEKSAKELAVDIMREQAGLNNDVAKIKYPEYGIYQGAGVFVKAAIAEGNTIPFKPGFTDAQINEINNATGPTIMQQFLTENYEALLDSKSKVAEANAKSDNTVAAIQKKIQKNADKQKKLIEKQEKAKAKQDTDNKDTVNLAQ